MYIMSNREIPKFKNAPDMCIVDENKICDKCCDCYICDLDSNKLCDNCAKCINVADFKAIEVTEILYDDNIFKYCKNLKKNHNNKHKDQEK